MPTATIARAITPEQAAHALQEQGIARTVTAAIEEKLGSARDS